VSLSSLPRRRSALPRVRPDLVGRASVVFVPRDDDQTPIALPEGEELEQTSAADLEKIRDRARAEIEKIKAKDDISDEDVAEAERLAQVMKGAKTEVKRRETAEEDRRKRLDAVDVDDDDQDGDDDGQDDQDDDDQDGDDGQDGDDSADADDSAPAGKEPVLAGADGGKPKTGRAARAARRQQEPKPPARRTATITAAADVPGMKANHTFGNFTEVAEVANRRLASYPSRPMPSASGHSTRLQHGIARIRRDFDADLIADVNGDDVLTFAAQESRLPGGSLVAAGGWCAPSETLYDLTELESADGLIDVPEVNARRGGIRFTPGPDYSAIYAGTGFAQTEAQAIAGETKDCYRVPCPDFAEVRAEAVGVCITSGILQNHAYPELTARVTRGALIAHAHKVSAKTIAKMVAGSTAVAPTALLGATASLLSAAELAALDTRYRHRMPLTATVEQVYPLFAYALVRADLAQRSGVMALDVTDAQIRGWFAERQIRAQFVYDWQDTALGQAVPAVALPASTQFLSYPAGTWVRGLDEVINLDTVYDSAGLVENDYVGLFTEEALLVAKTGHDSRRYTVATPANGATYPTAVPVPAA